MIEFNTIWFLFVFLAYTSKVKGREPRIVGGFIVDPPDKYEFMAAIYKKSGSNLNYVCSGILVNPNVILTAAHCESAIDVIGLGKFTHAQKPFEGDEKSEFYDAIEIVVHPNYNPSTLDNDLALIKMNSTARTYQSVVLHDGYNVDIAPGDTMRAMGHGRLYDGGPLSNELRAVDVEIVSNGQCAQLYETTGDEITENMMCARDEGKDACQGDSGGALITTDGRNILVGVVSSGYGCAEFQYPGVYAKVSGTFTKSWLQSTIFNFEADMDPSPTPSLRPSTKPSSLITQFPSLTPIYAPTKQLDVKIEKAMSSTAWHHKLIGVRALIILTTLILNVV